MLVFLTGSPKVWGQIIPGFKATGSFDEQEMRTEGIQPGVTVLINAPLHFKVGARTKLVLYALPNGNSIEWTKGKIMQPGDDWHYDIQHIAAQLRFVRRLDTNTNYFLAYLVTVQKSWPAWKKANPLGKEMIRQLTDSLTSMFSYLQPRILLNSHSGGGSFIFGYLDAVHKIPDQIERISFLDSEYGYNDTLHLKKISEWLKKDRRNTLFALAYNDSVVIYNGKPLVSPTGGTWYRSRLLQRGLSAFFRFNVSTDTAFARYYEKKNRIGIILKENPAGLIYHTVQVERNGFIYSLLFHTRFDKDKYFRYFGERAYRTYIDENE